MKKFFIFLLSFLIIFNSLSFSAFAESIPVSDVVDELTAWESTETKFKNALSAGALNNANSVLIQANLQYNKIMSDASISDSNKRLVADSYSDMISNFTPAMIRCNVGAYVGKNDADVLAYANNYFNSSIYKNSYSDINHFLADHTSWDSFGCHFDQDAQSMLNGYSQQIKDPSSTEGSLNTAPEGQPSNATNFLQGESTFTEYFVASADFLNPVLFPNADLYKICKKIITNNPDYWITITSYYGGVYRIFATSQAPAGGVLARQYWNNDKIAIPLYTDNWDQNFNKNIDGDKALISIKTTFNPYQPDADLQYWYYNSDGEMVSLSESQILKLDIDNILIPDSTVSQVDTAGWFSVENSVLYKSADALTNDFKSDGQMLGVNMQGSAPALFHGSGSVTAIPVYNTLNDLKKGTIGKTRVSITGLDSSQPSVSVQTIVNNMTSSNPSGSNPNGGNGNNNNNNNNDNSGSGVFDGIISALGGLFEGLGKLLGKIIEFIVGLVTQAVDGVITLFDKLVLLVDGLLDSTENLTELYSQALDWIDPTITACITVSFVLCVILRILKR